MLLLTDKLEIEPVIKRCTCKYCKKKIEKGDDRVQNWISQGFYCPLCTIKQIDKDIDKLNTLKNDFIKKYQDKLMFKSLE